MIANQCRAALVGAEMSSFLGGRWFRYVVAVSFIAMAVWTLISDKLDDIEDKPPRFGAFLTTTIAFFFVEMGDKTQIATIALDRKSTRLNYSHQCAARMPSAACKKNNYDNDTHLLNTYYV